MIGKPRNLCRSGVLGADNSRHESCPAAGRRSSCTANEDRSLGIWVVNLFILSLMCGCVPPANKATQARTGRAHHHAATHSNSRAHRELTNAEKEALFQNFERWRAANRRIPDTALPIVEVDQPVEVQR
jgi:hypothetical protein